MYIGKPIRYVSGPLLDVLSGWSELSEYQKPDLGRKFAKRDRRPVDPPPVVRLQLFETKMQGLPIRERKSCMQNVSGLVAHVDMFPVNPSEEMRRIESIESSQSSASLATTSNPQQISPINEAHYNHWTSDCVIDINEDSKLTTAVFGSSFVHAVQVLDMSGEHDLSVKLEGHRVAGSEDVLSLRSFLAGLRDLFHQRVPWTTSVHPPYKASRPLGSSCESRETSRRKKGKQGEGDEEEDGDSSGAGDAIVDEERETQFYSPNFLAPYTSQVDTSSRFTPVTFSAPTTYQEQHDQYGQGSPARQIQDPGSIDECSERIAFLTCCVYTSRGSWESEGI
ncbi:velvet factor [Ceratobasidium sp. AG-Ba]|nr:velvet factor [Ceratobasidium sp. AG-Ba]